MRARALAGALVAVPLSMVLGGPLCGWLLGVMNPIGLPAWRFMFLMLAVPNLVLAVAAALYLVDTPRQARWLTASDADWLERQSVAHPAGAPTNSHRFVDVARDPWLWRCCAGWLLIMTGSYALVFWLPQLVRQMHFGGSELVIATLSALPLLGLALGLWGNGRRSDRKAERLLHVGIPSALAGGAMLIAAALAPGWPVLGLLFLAGIGIGAAQGVFWAIPSTVRIGGATPPAGVIALISMFGTLGGIIGPWLVGALVGRTGNFSLAIGLLASLLIVALPVIAPDRAGRSRG
jgi:ACS family tartrate transporter-like MFS transporter